MGGADVDRLSGAKGERGSELEEVQLRKESRERSDSSDMHGEYRETEYLGGVVISAGQQTTKETKKGL